MLEYVGNRLYDFILMDRHVNSVRRIFSYPYWSVATFLKSQMKDAMKYIHNYERALVSEARKRGVDGVICVIIIHRAEVTQHDDVIYCNDGDWVESCTTLVEDHSGKLLLLRWTENREVILDATRSVPLIRSLAGSRCVNSDAWLNVSSLSPMR